MTLDTETLVARVAFAINAAADAPVMSRYGEAKVRAVVQYADLIADAYASGALDDDDMARELDEIGHMMRRATRNMRGLSGAKAERAATDAIALVAGAMAAGLSYMGSPIPAHVLTHGRGDQS